MRAMSLKEGDSASIRKEGIGTPPQATLECSGNFMEEGSGADRLSTHTWGEKF